MGLRIAIYFQVVYVALVGAATRGWLPPADILIYLASVSSIVFPGVAVWVVATEHRLRWKRMGFWFIEAMLVVAYFMALLPAIQ